ncbi:hypothetical protein ILP92_02585 [Maribius pontilimi]|uniref:Uncharacterized protein n=1 Tax=Palleronia pontilimi TaxID=1964209 RepID=A0A934IEE4_9RHOB|nr:hypothetical protein [Palleronia pontilimi]MBJ3761637.1 hypothetical protein [Palleronia pontilimi]
MTRVAVAIAACAALAAPPASALSCLKPDLARSYLAAEQSEDVYSVILGALEFDASAPPFNGTRALETSIPARINGRVLGQDGFANYISRNIVLQVSCVADAWCGSAMAPGSRVMAFLRHAGDGLVLDLDPCPQWLFADPSAEQVARVADCFTGGPCVPGDGG